MRADEFARRSVSRAFATLTAGIALSILASSAQGQHSASIATECDPNPCPGSSLICEVLAGNNDAFHDTIEVLEAWNVVDPKGAGIRVPAAGSLSISYVYGNTDCVVGGSLPCKLCAPGSTACGMNVPDPGAYGAIEFLAFDYIVQANDPSPLESQANVRLRDLCDVSPAGCSTLSHRLQFTTATPLLHCDDGNECTVDYCAESTCFSVPDCETSAQCDDGNPCSQSSCSAEGCCVETPLCVSNADCDDSNPCTSNVCVAGCCEHTPQCLSSAQCNDGNPCTTSVCTPAGCCVHTPLCTSDDQCDDGNPCVDSACVGGCCSFQPACILDAHCDDGHPCTLDACTAEGCCVSELLESCACELGDVSADFDGNGTVDDADYQTLYGCLTGPASQTGLACIPTDLDCSLSVDLRDFAGVQGDWKPGEKSP